MISYLGLWAHILVHIFSFPDFIVVQVFWSLFSNSFRFFGHFCLTLFLNRVCGFSCFTFRKAYCTYVTKIITISTSSFTSLYYCTIQKKNILLYVVFLCNLALCILLISPGTSNSTTLLLTLLLYGIAPSWVSGNYPQITFWPSIFARWLFSWPCSLFLLLWWSGCYSVQHLKPSFRTNWLDWLR